MKCIMFFLSQFVVLGTVFSQDTSTLHDQVNRAIVESINKLPPNIGIKFFVNGKEKKRGYRLFIVCGGEKITQAKRHLIKLNSGLLKNQDSIYFLVEYKGNAISTRKYKPKQFLHGGQLVTGLAADFFYEKKRYLSDTVYYKRQNAKSYLPHFVRKDNAEIDKKKLIYSVMKNNTNIWIEYKFEFRE